MAKEKYLAIKGFNYGKEDTRVEAGTIVDDLPEKVVAALLKADAIEVVEGRGQTARAKEIEAAHRAAKREVKAGSTDKAPEELVEEALAAEAAEAEEEE